MEQNWSRVKIANQKTEAATKEGRILRRQSQKDALDIASAAGTLLYKPGIDDSICKLKKKISRVYSR